MRSRDVSSCGMTAEARAKRPDASTSAGQSGQLTKRGGPDTTSRMSPVLRIPAVTQLGVLVAGFTLTLHAQQGAPRPTPETTVALQPLAQQARRLEAALRFLGQPLPDADQPALLGDAIAQTDEAAGGGRTCRAPWIVTCSPLSISIPRAG